MKANQAFGFNIQRSRRLVRLYRGLRAGGRLHQATADLLRAAYVLAVGALDAYIHDRISERLVPFIRKSIQGDRENLKPIANLLKTRKVEPIEFLIAASRPRPFVQVRKQLDQFLYEDAYQHPGMIEEALQLIGIRDVWSTVADELGVDKDDLKRELASFAKRRNQIVHEGDRERSRRRRHRRRPIGADEVDTAINRISESVKEIASLR